MHICLTTLCQLFQHEKRECYLRFLELRQLLNTESYLAGNVGSGTVQEMANWY